MVELLTDEQVENLVRQMMATPRKRRSAMLAASRAAAERIQRAAKNMKAEIMKKGARMFRTIEKTDPSGERDA